MATRKSTLLPRWILRVVGYSSLAVAVVGIALYWYKRYPPRRRIDGNERANNNEVTYDMSLYKGIVCLFDVILDS
jgi:hypothetical protein